MPGPVSDSFDPEFGTGYNCSRVEAAVKEAIGRFSDLLGPELHNILDILDEDRYLGRVERLELTEREMRVIRFALIRSLDTL